MKKILAILIALLMITACAAEDDSGMQSSAADGSGSSAGTVSEPSENSSMESSSEQSHSSQQSGDPAPGKSESNSSDISGGSGIYSETSSAPGFISGGSLEPISPITSGTGAEAMENSYVKRVSTLSSNYIIWYHAENEQADEKDRPIVVIENIDELTSFLMDMDGLYFQSYGENSAGTLLRGYDEAFFEENVIILTHLKSSSGSVRYTITGIDVSGGLCVMSIKAEMPEVGTADMADWFAFAELPKSALAGCEDYIIYIY